MRGTLRSIAVLTLIIGGYYLLFFLAGKYDKWKAQQPRPRSIVYACPDKDNSVKCYKLEADISSQCDDDGDGNSSCYGVLNRIYFPNKGYIDFDDCPEDSRGKFSCYAADINDGYWKVEYTGEKTTIKYPSI